MPHPKKATQDDPDPFYAFDALFDRRHRKRTRALHLPFPDFLARALIGLFTTRKATLHEIRFVTADREFIGGAWIGWLLRQKVPFRIRIKAG